jgi:hypothetical protein
MHPYPSRNVDKEEESGNHKYRHKEYLKPPVPHHEKERVTVVKKKAVTQGSGQTTWDGVEGRSNQRQNRKDTTVEYTRAFNVLQIHCTTENSC